MKIIHFLILPILETRAEILQKFGLFFRRFEKPQNSFLRLTDHYFFYLPSFFAALGIGRNQTEIDPETTLSKCGVHFCPPDGSTKKDDSKSVINGSSTVVDENFKTTDTQIYVLAGVYLACSLLAPILIAVFVEPLSRFVDLGLLLSYLSLEGKIRKCLFFYIKIF